MLQRIYGTAWASKKALEAHLHRLEEAEKRDHRKLGVELDLFSLPRRDRLAASPCSTRRAASSAGSWRTTRRQRHEQAGYEFVYSPHITKVDAVRDERATSTGTPTACTRRWSSTGAPSYYLKPMNCPFHILIFRSRQRSLPRAAAAALRVRHGVPLREVAASSTASRGPAASPRTTPTSSATAGAAWPTSCASLLDFVLDLLRDYGLDDFYARAVDHARPRSRSATDEEWDEATEALRTVALDARASSS